MVKLGLGILLLFFPFYVLAQGFTPDPDWRFENFNSQNHFISREILSLSTDKHGYVWTCSDGVQRFDGNKTVYFNSFDRAKGSLRDNYTSVITDVNGRVWINSAGLCYYDDASGEFIYVQPDSKHNITAVNACYVQNNYIWFVCEYGLAKINVRSLKISFTSLATIVDPLCTYQLDENTLLISSREKVYTYNIKNNTYSANTLIYNHSLVKIFSVTKNDHDIYLGTNQGLFTYKNLFNISPVANETKDNEINELQFVPEDRYKKYLFLATERNGIKIFNTISKKIEFTFLHDDNNPYSLSDNEVSTFYPDKKGKLWIGTGSGISMLDLANQQWKMRFLNKSTIDGLSINRIARDKSDSSRVWMSSYTQGMIYINWKKKKIERIFNTNPELLRIYDFVQLSKNKLLLVTQKKLIEWDPKSGILFKSELPIADSLALVYNIRRLIRADTSTCFITTNNGLFKYDMKTRRISSASVKTNIKKKEDQLKYDLQDGFYDNGLLWIASRNGLFNYDISKRKTTIYRGNGGVADYFFFDVSNSTNDRIVCASGDGISIFNKQTKNFDVINLIGNLLKPHCESVITANNTIWVGTEVGVFKYNLNTHLSERAQQANPLMQFFPSSPFAVVGKDIVLGFSDGYAYFTPFLKDVLIPSDPVIERVYVNNRPVLQQYTKKRTEPDLVFTHSNNSINIIFTAFLYTDPDHIKFRYRLKGADPEWLYSEGERSANYAQLPPGKYAFYLQCGNKNGIWNNNLAFFNFVIQPPFWETWWFRTLLILLIAFGLYSLYRYKIKHLLAIERIREKIASDFHDDIGAALSSISIFSEVADTQLEEQLPHEQIREIISHISSQSHAMLDTLDDIIWAVNPQNDHFYDLAVRMREFAIPLLEAKNILFDINIQEEILNTRIRMEVRKNIFLIFKECVNNIVKHACCSEMKVSVMKLNSQLEMVISDNGNGFDVDAPHSRNGLKNMQKRTLEIKGEIAVKSMSGKGTITRLLVNII